MWPRPYSPASTPGKASGRSSAISPGPKARAAAPCSHTAARRGLERRDALRREAGDEPGQHVAGPCGRQRRRQVPADRRAPVRRGDDGVGALERRPPRP